MQSRPIKFRAWDKSGKYVAGSDGFVYSTDFNHTGKTKALKGWINKYGYPEVLLNISGKRVVGVAHRFIALAFLGKRPSSKHQINHKNGNRADNRPENLEYLTQVENILHGWRVNKRKPSEKQRGQGRKLATMINKKRWNYEKTN